MSPFYHLQSLRFSSEESLLSNARFPFRPALNSELYPPAAAGVVTGCTADTSCAAITGATCVTTAGPDQGLCNAAGAAFPSTLCRHLSQSFSQHTSTPLT